MGLDIGAANNIPNLTLSDLVEFYKTHYNQHNMNFICCGPQEIKIFDKKPRFNFNHLPNFLPQEKIHKFKCSTGLCLSKSFKLTLGTGQKIFAVFKRLNQGILEMTNIAKLELLQHMITYSFV